MKGTFLGESRKNFVNLMRFLIFNRNEYIQQLLFVLVGLMKVLKAKREIKKGSGQKKKYQGSNKLEKTQNERNKREFIEI